MKREVTISVRSLVLIGLLTVAAAVVLTANRTPAQSVSAAELEAHAMVGFGSWELQTRVYVGSPDTWDAYLLNHATGDLYFINQAKRTLVAQGKAKGTK